MIFRKTSAAAARTAEAPRSGAGGAPVDETRVEMMEILAGHALRLDEVGAAMAKVPRERLARTLAEAAKEGLVAIEGGKVSLTAFGQRVLRAF